ncbi:hypothetical protein BCR33DRAFT_720054 [Rhizoclosmatium globosum]|uniref:Uncharacterized protein n=1 Tax=Rhizoclosmatium globosum TaxID=329046 RepID=A0A1Y2BXV5_9FUNG|nr:hypothetical protein BCR33DRAFT_720054 [Rhizoclosmatium globosum]|eukprot:ORY39602.1 hypothetical protein BCR33DRAFT_720054 [Rhizoclosmatium globosum]
MELQHTKDEVLNGEKEIEQLKADIKRIEAKTRSEEEAFEKKKKEMDEQVSRLKAELKMLDALRANAKKNEEDVRNQIRIKQAVIEGIEKETALIGNSQFSTIEEFEERERAIDEDLKVWNEIHEKLLSELQRHKAELKEEKRVKEVLLHELSRSRSKTNMDITGDHSLNKPGSSSRGGKIRLLQSPPPILQQPQLFHEPPPVVQATSQTQRSLLDPTVLEFEPVQRLPNAFDLMGTHLPRMPSNVNRNMTPPSLLHHSPTEPPGLGFKYSHAPAYTSAAASISAPLASNLAQKSPKDDDIERAVANSLMGEIRGGMV